MADPIPTADVAPPPPEGDDVALALSAMHGLLPTPDEAALQGGQRTADIQSGIRAVTTAIGNLVAPNLTRYATEPPPPAPPPPAPGFVGKVPSESPVDPRVIGAVSDVAQLGMLPFGGAELRGAAAARTAEDAALAARAAATRPPVSTAEAGPVYDAVAARARVARTIEQLRAPPAPEPPTGRGFTPGRKTPEERIRELERFAHDDAEDERYWEDRAANVHPQDAAAEMERLHREMQEYLDSVPQHIKDELERKLRDLDNGKK